MASYENVKEYRQMPSVTNDMKNGDAEDDDDEFVAQRKETSKGLVDSNGKETSQEDNALRRSVKLSLAFKNDAYTYDDDLSDDDDGIEEEEVDDYDRNNKTEKSAQLTNTLAGTKKVEEINLHKGRTRDASQTQPGRKSVSFKNEKESNNDMKFPENKSLTSTKDKEFPGENISQTSISSEDTEGEESESEKEFSDDINFSPELVSQVERLRSSGKIEKAALIDFNGNILVRTRGMEMTSEDATTVLRVLNSPDKSLVKIRIGKEDFTCFKNSETSFIGKTDTDFLCASSCVDFVVVGLSDPNSPGSCICEVSRLVRRCNRNSTISNNGYESATV